MTTDRQLQANRENAKKSTGPRSPEGKARSSKNALKHGLLAADSVIPGEDPAEFDRHLTLFENTYVPKNYIEREIVRQAADAAWRMQRLSRIESAAVTVAMARRRKHRLRYGQESALEGHEADLELLGASMLDDTKLLNNLGRYDGHLTRRFYRAVEMMMKIRRQEAKFRDAEAKDSTNRHRGVDGSPRSDDESTWKETLENYGPKEDYDEDNGPVNHTQAVPTAGRRGPASASRSGGDPRNDALREKLLDEANALVNALKNRQFPELADESLRPEATQEPTATPSQ